MEQVTQYHAIVLRKKTTVDQLGCEVHHRQILALMERMDPFVQLEHSYFKKKMLYTLSNAIAMGNSNEDNM